MPMSSSCKSIKKPKYKDQKSDKSGLLILSHCLSVILERFWPSLVLKALHVLILSISLISKSKTLKALGIKPMQAVVQTFTDACHTLLRTSLSKILAIWKQSTSMPAGQLSTLTGTPRKRDNLQRHISSMVTSMAAYSSAALSPMRQRSPESWWLTIQPTSLSTPANRTTVTSGL